MNSLPLDDFALILEGENCFPIARATFEVDGDDWGEVTIEEAQARLVEEDDLAVIQLEAPFVSAGALEGLGVAVTASGLRQVNLDETYLVPVPGAGAEGFERYEMPSPLPAGAHRFDWSYVWNPPKDLDTGEVLEDGVDLQPLEVRGRFAVTPEGPAPLPERVHLAELEAAGLLAVTGGASFTREVVLPATARELKVEGGPADLEVHGPDGALTRLAATGGFELPGGDERFTLTLRMPTQVVAIRGLIVG